MKDAHWVGFYQLGVRKQWKWRAMTGQWACDVLADYEGEFFHQRKAIVWLIIKIKKNW